MEKNLIFTGGGSGGHVVPALTIMEDPGLFNSLQIRYIGSHTGIERKLLAERNIPYTSISTGKFRRYLSWQNLTDVVRIKWGFFQAFRFLWGFRNKDTLVFSTGGFVSVPVVAAACLQGKTVFIHEQTSRVGLANRIGSNFATRVFVSFRESLPFFPEGKTVYSGYPLRPACYEWDFRPIIVGGKSVPLDRPLMFVTGGGNGSSLLNDVVRRNLDWLRPRLRIVHQVGKNFIDEFRTLADDGYIVSEFVTDSFLDLLKASPVVVSRAGAGTVCELLAVGRRSLFVPLKIAQQNEQFHNAREAEKTLGSTIIQEDDLNDGNFRAAVENLLNNPAREKTNLPNGLNVLRTAISDWFDRP